ncbi:hypothetical protein [Bradyrhizobium sp.]|uniref:hypothetical protein n=1 Tax=Bradyrhizobium sp. TaxID=376 RepID=UPI003C7699FF
MSRLATGIFGAITLLLTFGAAQFASGRDLSEATQDRPPNSVAAPLAAGGTAVNRASKADRVANVMGSSAQTRTISLRLDGFSDTSFLVRVPVATGAGNSSSAPSGTKSGNRRLTVACEPVVSVLTEVAKLLQPGRCVT